MSVSLGSYDFVWKCEGLGVLGEKCEGLGVLAASERNGGYSGMKRY
jgi:hypothetical protein